MNRALSKFKTRLKTLPIFYLYDVKDDGGRGRFVMLMSGIVGGIAGQLSGGLFYTSFLLQYGLDMSQIAILNFIPYISCFLQLFSPSIMERFPKRKWILFGTGVLTNALSILGTTLLPMLIKDNNIILLMFATIIVSVNSISALFSSGSSAWQANFLPENVRVDYFNTTNCITSGITMAVTLIVSVIGDSVMGSEHELFMLTVIRLIAFALTVVSSAMWLIPKEYPYAKTVVRPKLSHVFTLPMKEKKFLLTILIGAAYTFVVSIPNATLNVYILQDVGVKYTLCNGIDSTYFLFFIFFSAMWKKLINKLYWFRALTVVVLLHAVTFFMYSFVTADTLWLYIVVRFSQHILGVATSAIFSSLPYLYLPETDRTNYLTFNSVVGSLVGFFSSMVGTVFTAVFANNVGDVGNVSFFGYPFSSTQILLFASGVGQVIVAIVSWAFSRKLTPPECILKKEKI